MDNEYWQNNGFICPYCDCEYDFTTHVKIETCFRGILTLSCLCPACHKDWDMALETKIAKGV